MYTIHFYSGITEKDTTLTVSTQEQLLSLLTTIHTMDGIIKSVTYKEEI